MSSVRHIALEDPPPFISEDHNYFCFLPRLPPGVRLCSDKGMRIALDIEEVDFEWIVGSLDNQYAYLWSRNREDPGFRK
jgi:hypothetical protein